MFLAPYLFATGQDYQLYVQRHLRFTLATSTSDSISLDTRNGHVTLKTATRPSSQPITLNVSVSDSHRLFRTATIQLHIRLTNTQQVARPLINQSKQIIEMTLRRHQRGLISAKLSQYPVINEFSRLQQCWVNGHQATEKTYLNLNNGVFNGFSSMHQIGGEGTDLEPKLIECQLTERNTWLKLHVLDELETKPVELVQLSNHVNVDRHVNGMVFDLKSLLDGMRHTDLNGYQMLFTMLSDDYLTRYFWSLGTNTVRNDFTFMEKFVSLYRSEAWGDGF